MIRFLILFCYGVFFFVSSVSAQDGDTGTENLSVLDQPWKPNQSAEIIQQNGLLKRLLSQGVQLAPIGQELGYDGWLTYKDDQIQVFYTVPGLEGVLSGVLIGPEGENITAFQLARYEATSGNTVTDKIRQGFEKALDEKQQTMPGRLMLKEATQAVWIGYGGDQTQADKPVPILYVFMSPACDGCSDYLDQMVQNYAQKNLLQLRIVPVYHSPKEKKLVEQILASDSPGKAWLDWMLDGKAPPPLTISPALRESIESNQAILSSRNLDKTPLTLYQSGTRLVKIIQGVPKDIQSVVFDLTVGQ